MDDKKPINPKLTPALHAEFVAYCKAQRLTQSDAVEAALLGWLHPRDDGDLFQLLLDKLVRVEGKVEGLEEAFGTVLGFLQTMTTHLEAQQSPPVPPVADFFSVYPQLRPVGVETGAEEEPAPVVESPQDGLPARQRFDWWRFGKRFR